MRYFVRIYRRYDFDLYTLAVNGYRVDDLIRDSATAYAHEKPFHVYVDRVLPPSAATGKGKILYNITIDKNDKETIDMLRHIVKGFRNNFFKSCARNALLKQNLSMYFPEKEYLRFEKANMLEYVDAGNGMEGLHSLSIYRDSGHDQKEFTELLRGTDDARSAAASPALREDLRRIHSEASGKNAPKTQPVPSSAPDEDSAASVPAAAAENSIPAAVRPVPPDSSSSLTAQEEAELSRSTDLPGAAPEDDMHSEDDPNDIMSMFDNL